ncbi:hypothetical protein [Egbenema bharatensis]|uniref:hypothetical protein n=1 Tax=Egbenema bharatensis TaxID=3463334 RepID=UPI003A8C78C1
MIQILDEGDRLWIISSVTWQERLLFAFLALLPLLAPYELVLRIQWRDYRHPVFILAAFISIGAIAVSLLFICAALAGLNFQTTLDTTRSTFSYSESAPVIRSRTQVFPLSSLDSIEIRSHEWSDGAPSYSLMIKIGRATFKAGSSWSRQEIEQAKAQIEAFLDRECPLWRSS